MGEALITRAGSGEGGGEVSEARLVTKIITDNCSFKVPKTGNYSVRIFGGGGNADNTGKGGGGGYMNNNIIRLAQNQTVQIMIGDAGESSFFGNYLSANGGGTSDGGSGGGGGAYIGGTGYQFGGGAGGSQGAGGDGGYWGGGGASAKSYWRGNGGYYGGGAGGFDFSMSRFGGSITNKNSGYGGYYGGGGGYYDTITVVRQNNMMNTTSIPGGCIREDPYNTQSKVIGYSGLGGNSGYLNDNVPVNGSNGTDTYAWTNIYGENGILFTGNGLGGFSNKSAPFNSLFSSDKNQYIDIWIGAGGGFGGNAGNKGQTSAPGGGGYGSNGGNYGGGGGGFGGDGGSWLGGGGGYGKSAKGGSWIGGGGGYYGKGGDGGNLINGAGNLILMIGGGGGGYGDGGSVNLILSNRNSFNVSNRDGLVYYDPPGYAGGGIWPYNGGAGGKGICIIQYYG